MNIRNKYQSLKSVCKYTPDPISMCVPDQSLTIKQLFDRYQVNTAELMIMLRMRKTKQDLNKVSFDDIIPNLDANQVYELRKKLSAKYKSPDLMRNSNNLSDVVKPINVEQTDKVD